MCHLQARECGLVGAFSSARLLGIGFATFWGTIFPIISEAVRGVKITVGPPFYNQVNVPIGMALLALIGIGPVIAWRRASFSNLKRNFLKPLATAAVFAVALLPFIPLGNRAEIFSYITFVLCVFVMVCILSEFFKGSVARMGMNEESPLGALTALTWKNKRRYGGYVVHIGVVLIFAGIAGSQAYGTHTQKHLEKGETIELRGYTLKYEGITPVEDTSVKTRVIAQIGVYRNGERIWTGRPEKEFYKGQNQPVSEVDVLSSWKEDVYLILADFTESESATIKVYVNPMVSWIWTGGWIIAFGTVVCMWPDRLEQRRRLSRMKKQAAVFAPAQE